MKQTSSGHGAFALAAAILLADIATKAAIAALMPIGSHVEITPWFNLGHWVNPGAAFGLLAQAGGWQRVFFVVVGLIAAVVLVWLILRGRATALERTGYAAILGGALGNVADRMFRGQVVDWLDLHWGDWHWPAFNIADIGITSGAAMLVLVSVWRQAGRPRTRQEMSH